ncbi:hypothetical protein L345_14208, partial [Ophiophagus hannah]
QEAEGAREEPSVGPGAPVRQAGKQAGSSLVRSPAGNARGRRLLLGPAAGEAATGAAGGARKAPGQRLGGQNSPVLSDQLNRIETLHHKAIQECNLYHGNCIVMTTPETLEGEEGTDASAGKDLPSSPEETKRKPSQDHSDGSDSPPLDSILLHSPEETEFNGGTGNQTLLQGDEFPFETLCDVVGDASLQENFPGKVKNFEQNLCLESPPVI